MEKEDNKYVRIEKTDDINNIENTVYKPTLVNPIFLFFPSKSKQPRLKHMVNSIGPMTDEIYDVLESGTVNTYDINWFVGDQYPPDVAIVSSNEKENEEENVAEDEDDLEQYESDEDESTDDDDENDIEDTFQLF